MATSICAEGKIRVKRHEGKELPYECIVDKFGKLTRDPEAFYDGGAILPLGGEVGYKGFSLGMAVEILAGILSGTGYSYSEKFRGGNGVYMQAINVNSFMSLSDFKREVRDFTLAIRNSKPRPGFKEILTPGEIEFRTRRKRIKEGIYIPEKTWKDVLKIGFELGLNIERILTERSQY